MTSRVVTYQTRINPQDDSFCREMGCLFSQIEHNLYLDLSRKDKPLKDLKREYQIRYQINARQFNSIQLILKGKISSANECRKLQINNLKSQIKGLEESLKQKEKKLKKTPYSCGINGQKSQPRAILKWVMHQKKRKLHKLKLKLEKVKNTQSSILFGSKKLWNKQFNLEANGYKNHQEWLTDWRNARISGFTLIGSSDETKGNQNCQLVGNTLKIRVPPALEHLYGKYYYLKNITFPYGQEDINYALSRKQALTYKFSYKNDKWYLNCSITIPEVPYQSNKNNGCLGLDINPNVIGWAYCDQEGNLKDKGQIKFNLRDKSTHQVKAIVGDVVKELVAIASKYKCPIAIEKLDFSSKKASMKESGIRYSRMLSNFAYSTITEMLDSRGSKYGIQIVKFNPAYSSFIGLCKYLKMYGLSSDTAAALVLARRMYYYSERVPAILASLVPVDTSKHVWSLWNKVKKELGQLKRHNFFSGVANSDAVVNLQDEAQARSSRKQIRHFSTEVRVLCTS